MTDPVSQAAAAVRRSERMETPFSAGAGGQPIGECLNCDSRFCYGLGADVGNMDPCPGCGARDWHKWGYRFNGEEIRRDDASDRYDPPPSSRSSDTPSTGVERNGGDESDGE